MLKGFFSRDRNLTTVHEPDSHVYIDFFYRRFDENEDEDEEDEDDEEPEVSDSAEEEAGEVPVMQIQLIGSSLHRQEEAQRIGLPEPKELWIYPSFGPHRGKSIMLLQYLCPLENAVQAAQLCFTALEQVFSISTDKWLWITDIEQPDDWPDPLPKPLMWPSS